METGFESIFNKISLLIKYKLEDIGLNLGTTEEIDYFSFCIIATLYLEAKHCPKAFYMQFIQIMTHKYGQYDHQLFQIKQYTYQYYILLFLQNQTPLSGIDPIMVIAYILSDQSIDPKFDVHIKMILLIMTIKDIILQTQQYINSESSLFQELHKPDELL